MQLGELLVRAGKITREDLEKALAIQRAAGTGERIGATLTAYGLCSEEAVAEALSEQTGSPLLSAHVGVGDAAAIETIGEDFCREHELVPVREGRGYTVAMSDPTATEILDLVRQVLRGPVQPAVAGRSRVMELLDAATGPGDPLDDLVHDVDQRLSTDGAGVGQDAGPMARLIAEVCARASSMKATDIHLTPTVEDVAVRFRVDGALREGMRIPNRMLDPLAGHIRMVGGMGEAPASGRVALRAGHETHHFAAYLVPTTRGTKIALKALELPEWLGSLEDMDLAPEQLDGLLQSVGQPRGLVVLAGPEGSGRTSTLYACLGELRHCERDIATIEDPVEREILGVTQVSADPAAGLTAAAGLQALLDQEPEVIAIGDIRDPAVAGLAVRASIAGQMVLACVHAYDAVAAVTRLRDLGVEDDILSSGLTLVVAQRLVRTLCPNCRREREPDSLEVSAFARCDRAPPGVVYESTGCEACTHLGRAGRTAVAEVVEVDADLALAIADGAPEPVLRATARPTGRLLMFHAGLRLAATGRVCVRELLRAVPLPRKPLRPIEPETAMWSSSTTPEASWGPIPRQRVFGLGERTDSGSFEAFCRSLTDLPTLSTTVVRLHELMDAPRASMKDVAQVLEADQVVAARLLRMANSVALGARREITTIREAATHLGLSQIWSLAVATSALPALSASGIAELPLDELWSHAIGTALCAREVARATGQVDPDQAFLVGLLHDLGKLVLCLSRAEDFADCLRTARAAGVPLWQVEQDALAFSHGAVGGWLLQEWRLPATIAVPVEFHHHLSALPKDTPDAQRSLTLIVALANNAMKEAGLGGSGDTTTLAEAALLEAAGVDAEGLEGARATALAQTPLYLAALRPLTSPSDAR